MWQYKSLSVCVYTLYVSILQVMNKINLLLFCFHTQISAGSHNDILLWESFIFEQKQPERVISPCWLSTKYPATLSRQFGVWHLQMIRDSTSGEINDPRPITNLQLRHSYFGGGKWEDLMFMFWSLKLQGWCLFAKAKLISRYSV